jgi:hypothetical protein
VRPRLDAALLSLLLAAVPACAVRTATGEHYLGPTLFRSGTSCRGATQVSEVVQLGVVGEAGSQWGLVLGLAHRFAAAPVGAPAGGTADPAPRGRSPVVVPAGGVSRAWAFSPIYLRIAREPGPRFVKRALAGAQVTVGAEANAASIGVVSRTFWTLADDARCALDYDHRDPMATCFTVHAMEEER